MLMQKILLPIILICLMLFFYGCGQDASNNSQPSNTPASSEQLPVSQPSASETPAQTSTSKTATMYVTVDDTNLRTGPGTEFAVIKQLGYGETVTAYTEHTNNDWIEVSSGTNQGWVNSKLLSSSNPSAQNTNPTTQPTSGNISNKTYGWGFVRTTNHTQPNFGKTGVIASKYNAIYVGSPHSKKVYLTFDEGYENGYTAKILDTLKAKGVTATFFITGDYVEKNPVLVKRMFVEGHVVANHTVNHPSLPTLDDAGIIAEVTDLDKLVHAKTGYSLAHLVRPPKGEFSERSLALLKNNGYRTVFWSMAYADWQTDNQQGPERAINHVRDNLHPGAVILLHAVSKDNADGLGQIIDIVRAQDYTFNVLN